MGSLVEAVNVLGSLFYGPILGVFLVGVLPAARAAARAVFVGRIVAEAAVLACYTLTGISFLWFNLIGCAVVVLAALLITAVRPAASPISR